MKSTRQLLDTSNLRELLTFTPRHRHALRHGRRWRLVLGCISYLDLFRNPLTAIEDKKGKGLNHMEENACSGLEDIPALVEPYAFSLYSGIVPHPFIVRDTPVEYPRYL